MSAPVIGLAPAERGLTAAAAAVIGPDMTRLWQRFPPRTSAPSWPATEQAREALLGTLLAAPFTVEEDRVARARRPARAGPVVGLAGRAVGRHLAAAVAGLRRGRHGQRPVVAPTAWAGRAHVTRAGVSTSSNLRVRALLLIGADVIRPSPSGS